MKPLLNGGGDVVTADTGKAEVLDGFFAFFTNNLSYSSVLGTRVQRKLPVLAEVCIRDFLREFGWKAPWEQTDHIQGAERTG